MSKENLFLTIACFSIFLIGKMTAQNTVGLISIDHEKSVEGYNIVYPNHQSTVFLLDNCGQIVNTWEDPTNGRAGTSAYLLENGNLLRSKTNSTLSGTTFGAGGAGGIVEILSWENELLWSYLLADSLKRQHHDVYYMPNGNVLMIAWERKGLEEILENGFDTVTNNQKQIWSDYIIEVDPETDSIVWEWHTWDHLIQDYDSTKLNYGNVSEHPELVDINYHEYSFSRQDWMHSNGLDYNPETDEIMLCVRNFNEFWFIDHSTTTAEAAGHSGGNKGRGGDLLYRWGNPKAYKMGETEDRQLYWQHDAQWIDDFVNEDYEHYGKIALFNNMVDDGISFGQILEPEWDEANNAYAMSDGKFLPLTFTKTISHPDTIKNHSTTASSIQIMGDGNVMICAARPGFIFELTDDGEVAWEYRVPLKNGLPVEQGFELSLSDNFTHQAKRYPIEFPGFDGKDLTPQEYWELNPNTNFCSLTKNEEVKQDLKISIYPNPVDNFLIVENNEVIPIKIEVVDILGNIVFKNEFPVGANMVEMGGWPSGLYFLKNKNGGVLKKIIVK